MSDKPESYWQGFADGQKDMEKQMSLENEMIEPNDFVHKLDLFAGWLMGQIENNGSDEIDDEGKPIFANYGEATQAMFAAAFAQARLLRMVSACIFKLNQGDFTEEHFHHELDHGMNQLEEEANKIFQ